MSFIRSRSIIAVLFLTSGSTTLWAQEANATNTMIADSNQLAETIAADELADMNKKQSLTPSEALVKAAGKNYTFLGFDNNRTYVTATKNRDGTPRLSIIGYFGTNCMTSTIDEDLDGQYDTARQLASCLETESINQKRYDNEVRRLAFLAENR